MSKLIIKRDSHRLEKHCVLHWLMDHAPRAEPHRKTSGPCASRACSGTERKCNKSKTADFFWQRGDCFSRLAQPATKQSCVNSRRNCDLSSICHARSDDASQTTMTETMTETEKKREEGARCSSRDAARLTHRSRIPRTDVLKSLQGRPAVCARSDRRAAAAA